MVSIRLWEEFYAFNIYTQGQPVYEIALIYRSYVCSIIFLNPVLNVKIIIIFS